MTCLHFTALSSAYHVAALCHQEKCPLSPVFYRVCFRLRSYHKNFFASLLHTLKWVGSGQTLRRLPQSQSHMHPQMHLLQFVLRILYSVDHLD